MKITGPEKQFWWLFKRIKNTNKIPEKLEGFSSVDSVDDDENVGFLIDRIKIIHHIYMKETSLTDAGVKRIGEIKELKTLTLMKHPKITIESLPYLNRLTDLEYLDLWRTNILLKDVHHLTNLKNLKELYLSPTKRTEEGVFPEMSNDEILEKVIDLEVLFPKCAIYVDFELYLKK